MAKPKKEEIKISAPQFFKHCTEVYKLLVQRADADGIFRGYKYELHAEFSTTQPTFSRAFKRLLDMGCIIEEQGASPRRKTVVRCVEPPTIAKFQEVHGRKPTLTTRPSLDKVASDVENLQRRMPPIDLNSYIVSVEGRLLEIETRLTTLERRG